MAPTVAELGSLLGRDLSGAAQTAQAQQAITVAYWAARSFTRDVGFDTDGNPANDVRYAILTSAARIVSNPTLSAYSESEGPSAVSYARDWQGFSLGEQAILRRYRQMAL